MSNKDYYERWLKIKEDMKIAIAEDERLQELAEDFVGIKPQATAVEIISRVYSKYCNLYNKLCDCYDQMEQVQRRPYIRKMIDAITCRLLELKSTLEDVEVFEFTYPENALQQMLITPQDIKILCPFHYSFETRQEEMQYIVDEVFSGNRLGDPEPTPSELERREQERLEEEEKLQEEKQAELKRKLAIGEELSISDESEHLTPEEIEELRLQQEYSGHLLNIQRMERSRYVMRGINRKFNKDADLYLELAGLKSPQARESLRIKAAALIQSFYRRFMELKREHVKENKLKSILGLNIPSWRPPTAKEQLEKVKETRRNFRRKYYENWLQVNLKENSRVLRLREGDAMEDITSEINQWFHEWYDRIRVFDEFPWPEEGGSILIVRGETFTIEEYVDWRTAEEKRLKAEAGAPKTKEQKKAAKIAAREEKKRLKLEAKLHEQKRLQDYKKARMNPDNDPGVYVNIAKNIQPVREAWEHYQTQWKDIDKTDVALNVLKGYIMQLVTENAYQEMQFKLRPIVDEIMRNELNMLKRSLKMDYAYAEVQMPLIKKRKKPKKVKPLKQDKVTPERMFQQLVDAGIVRQYPQTTLEDYWGDLNYAAADMRAILWTPKFPPPCVGDVQEQVRVRCMLALCSSCPNALRTQLLVGPRGSGKRTLIYAIATETNSILIDLSPMNVYNKFPGPKNMKKMFQYVNKISRLMQPSIILVDNADKLFYKKVPKEEKLFDPTRLQKSFFKEIIKPINVAEDKILVLGTATEPWMSKSSAMKKVFPSLIMIPRTDYGSISIVLTKLLMKYHGIQRDFNVHSVAQVLRGYDINTIRKAVESLLNGRRMAALYHKPLQPLELINAVLNSEGAVYTGKADLEMYQQWYLSYSSMGPKYIDYMEILESQLNYKTKAEKKKNKSRIVPM